MSIRDLRATDATTAAALTPGWTAADYAAIARGDFPDRVCLVNDDTSALVLASVVAPGAEILNVFVRADLRRCGLATKLLTAMLEGLQTRGAARVWLEVRESNTAASSTYTKLGFRQTGRRQQYYQHPSEDALVMEKIFSDAP